MRSDMMRVASATRHITALRWAFVLFFGMPLAISAQETQQIDDERLYAYTITPAALYVGDRGEITVTVHSNASDICASFTTERLSTRVVHVEALRCVVDNAQTTITILFRAYQSGEIVMPPIALPSLPPIALTIPVASLTNEHQRFNQAVYQQLTPRITQIIFISWLLLLSCAIGAVLSLVHAHTKHTRQRSRSKANSNPTTTPAPRAAINRRKALHILQRLQHKIPHMSSKRYYYQLLLLIKRALQQQYRTPFSAYTSRSLGQYINTHLLGSVHDPQIAHLFSSAELAQYAAIEIANEDKIAHCAYARMLLMECNRL